MLNTTLCYIEKDGCYLMMHRTKKENDINKDKWIGIGGKFEDGESPEECLLREVREETGLILRDWSYRAVITFTSDEYPTEYMHLFTAPCPESYADSAQSDSTGIAWVTTANNPNYADSTGIARVTTADNPNHADSVGLARVTTAGSSRTASDGPSQIASGSIALKECDEGDLEWVPKEKMYSLPIWQGDKIFLRLIEDGSAPFFSLKLVYSGDKLVQAVKNGRENIEL